MAGCCRSRQPPVGHATSADRHGPHDGGGGGRDDPRGGRRGQGDARRDGQDLLTVHVVALGDSHSAARRPAHRVTGVDEAVLRHAEAAGGADASVRLKLRVRGGASREGRSMREDEPVTTYAAASDSWAPWRRHYLYGA